MVVHTLRKKFDISRHYTQILQTKSFVSCSYIYVDGSISQVKCYINYHRYTGIIIHINAHQHYFYWSRRRSRFLNCTYALQHSMLILVHLIEQSLQIFSKAAGGNESIPNETKFHPRILIEYHVNE